MEIKTRDIFENLLMIQKFVRTLTSVLPVDKRRIGNCNQCGECCRLPFTCAFLKTDSDGKSSCAAYKFRPPNCRKFPRTESQMKPVIKVCGYSFADVPVTSAEVPVTRLGDDLTDLSK